MNNTKPICPPLSPNDILNIRGQPVTKKIKSIRNSPLELEEWGYYNNRENTKELYMFKNGRLVKYKMEKAI